MTISDLPAKYQAEAYRQLGQAPEKPLGMARAQAVGRFPVEVVPTPSPRAKGAAKPIRQKTHTDLMNDAWFSSHGLPAPVPEFIFARPRKWRFDFAWPDKMVALEIEGGVWSGGRHTRGAGFLGDMEKYNQAAVMGWRVVRCVPDDAKSGTTADMLRKMLKLTP
jgi:hypothetical protein